MDSSAHPWATDNERGLSLRPIRALRPAVPDQRLGSLLCPPYDVIDARLRSELLAEDRDNAVSIVLPEPTEQGYRDAARELEARVGDGRYARDDRAGLYVYEMRTEDGDATRGLLGALRLHDYADGVVLPHENTMAGPVADRLALMEATGADLEPIYLVYDGGGDASRVVREVDADRPVAETRTRDGVIHRLWSVTDDDRLHAIAADLGERRALIADGHHRYATYLERRRRRHAAGDGAGPWDRGLTLLVDSTDYGPQVHAIHRVVSGLDVERAAELLRVAADVTPVTTGPEEALGALGAPGGAHGFAAVLTDGRRSFRVVADAVPAPADTSASEQLRALDVFVLHHGVRELWAIPDDETSIGYAHTADEAIELGRSRGGFAVLLRPTPVAAVAAIAAAGERMPRKSTLFTPKPASGLVLRRLSDDS